MSWVEREPVLRVASLARSLLRCYVLDMETAAIESLRTFALANNETAFAHLCTSALNGEAWAVERVTGALKLIATRSAALHAHVVALKAQASPEHKDYFEADVSPLTLEIVQTIDTTRPDGATARSIEV